MLILIIGGSGSGKSAYAEELLAHSDKEKYYLATMCADDAESRKRIARHKKQREGRGFHTLELPRHVSQAVSLMPNPMQSSVLLECMSNLTANEMFWDGGCSQCSEKELAERIGNDVLALSQNVATLIVVTNNVFEDGVCYEKTTEKYLRVLAQINRRMAKEADRMIEVVVGIPIEGKGTI